MRKVADFILMFAPEQWGETMRFSKMYSSTYEFDNRTTRAVSGVEAHFTKCLTLVSIARKLEPNLAIDKEQLDTKGFTPAINANEIAAVIEAAILELYSSIDCTVTVLNSIYGPTTRGFKQSTRGLFQNVEKLTGSFPDQLKMIIQRAEWYRELLYLRDELTHLATGSISMDESTNSLQYFNFGMKKNDEPFILEDIFKWLDTMINNVNIFLDQVFRHLNNGLKDEKVFLMCGMVKGRVLHRYVSPVGKLTFDSGNCGAWKWFEKPENPSCPFKSRCGAYLNKA